MVVPTLNVEEYQYTDSGLLLNGSSNGFPFVDVLDIDGLDTAPYRTQERDREGSDGAYIDAEFMSARTITIEGEVYTLPSDTESYLDQLKANFAPSKVAQPFYFMTDNGLRVAWGKSYGFNYKKDQQRRLGIHECQIQIVCGDPRVYDPYPTSVTATLTAVVTSGRSYPKSYPMVYGAAVGSNSVSVVLSGNRDTPAKLRINGPVLNPRIVYDNTGTELIFNTQIAAGDYIEIDLNNRSVLLNGATPRRTAMTLLGTWYLLEPGVNSFRFYGTQTPATPAATLQITAYSAWL